MDIVQGLTDDQVALLGCAAALAVCGSLLAISGLWGRRGVGQPHDEPARAGDVVRMPVPEETQDAPRRRAA